MGITCWCPSFIVRPEPLFLAVDAAEEEEQQQEQGTSHDDEVIAAAAAIIDNAALLLLDKAANDDGDDGRASPAGVMHFLEKSNNNDNTNPSAMDSPPTMSIGSNSNSSSNSTIMTLDDANTVENIITTIKTTTNCSSNKINRIIHHQDNNNEELLAITPPPPPSLIKEETIITMEAPATAAAASPSLVGPIVATESQISNTIQMNVNPVDDVNDLLQAATTTVHHMTHQLYMEQVATLKRKEALHEMTMQQLKEQMEQQRQQYEMTIANMMMMMMKQQQQKQEEEPPMEKQHEGRHDVGVVAVKSSVALRHTASVLNENKQRGIHKNRWKEHGEPVLQTSMGASGAYYARTVPPRCVAILQPEQEQQPSMTAIKQEEDECIHSCEPNNELNKKEAEDNNYYAITPTMETRNEDGDLEHHTLEELAGPWQLDRSTDNDNDEQYNQALYKRAKQSGMILLALFMGVTFRSPFFLLARLVIYMLSIWCKVKTQ